MLTIQAIDNKEHPSHEDIFVSWPVLQLQSVVDSYFLVLDEGLIPKVETFEKALIVLRKLLTDWQNTVRNLPEGDFAYLPFDFSDEYIGFLKVIMHQRVLQVRYGATQKIFGWSIYPSQSTPLPITNEDEAFLDPERVTISIDDFINQVEQIIQNIGS